MNATSEHVLSAAASTASSQSRFSVAEMMFLRTLASRFRWVGVVGMIAGVLIMLLPLLGRPSGAELLGGVIQGAVTVLLGALTRQVGVAFEPTAGGYGRSVDELWPALKRLYTLYNVYFILMLIALALFALAILMVLAMLAMR